ncbi:MAG TPA: argininosuccinate synthase [Armatimonadota bacterium]|jgi:argininosuccinate synthase
MSEVNGDYLIELPQCKKVAVAYSGGLDSALALKLLPDRYGAEEVLAITCDVGLTEQELEDCRMKAELCNVPWSLMDVQPEFVNDFITRAIYANSSYEGYPVATSMTRQLIARRVAEFAVEQGCDAICEGSTGKGNDQYRMANVFGMFAPDLKVIVPVREWNFTRQEEKVLSGEYGIPYNPGIGDDRTMWCRSIGSGEVDNLQMRIAQEDYMWYKYPENAPNVPTDLEIEFQAGLPVRVSSDEGVFTDLAAIIHYLNRVGGENSIGKIDMFEDGLIGLKSREVYEAPAAKIILGLHQDLEQLCLTKEQIQFKPSVERQWAYMVYHGGWFHPITQDCAAFCQSSQWAVNGVYKVRLFKGTIDILGRESSTGLFAPELRSLATAGWDQRESGPATKIHAMQYKILAKRGLNMD